MANPSFIPSLPYSTIQDVDGTVWLTQGSGFFDKQGNWFASIPRSRNGALYAVSEFKYQLISTPTGFGFTTYPFKIYRAGDGSITTDFDITSLIPAITVTYYVDPINGSDGNAGTSFGAPLLNLATALAKVDVDQIRIINLVADYVGRTTKSWNNVQPTKSLSVINTTAFRYISAKSASATLPTWIVNPSFSNVYQTTIASASAGQVIDTKIKAFQTYTDKNGAVQTLSNVSKLYATYTNATSAAAVSSTPGSWFHDGTNLHVRALDDRSLIGDGFLVLSTTGNNGRFGATVNALTHYIQGIDFVGGNAPFLALTAVNTNTGVLAFNDCTFQGSQSSSNALAVQGLFTVYTYRCATYYDKADGFNYHSFEADGTTQGTSPSWVEIENVSVGCGTTGSAAGSDNASTSHDYALGIRINGIYVNSDDRVVVETNFAQTWNLGCVVGQAVKNGAGVESIAALISAKQWWDSCIALDGPNPKWVAANSSTAEL
jgi:hypothetical protein